MFEQNVTILISPDSKLHHVLSSVLKTCFIIVYNSSMLKGVNRCFTTTMMIIDEINIRGRSIAVMSINTTFTKEEKTPDHLITLSLGFMRMFNECSMKSFGIPQGYTMV